MFGSLTPTLPTLANNMASPAHLSSKRKTNFAKVSATDRQHYKCSQLTVSDRRRTFVIHSRTECSVLSRPQITTRWWVMTFVCFT